MRKRRAYLVAHVIGGGAVEVIVGPLEELVLVVDLALSDSVVAHVELGLTLTKICWTCHIFS